MMIGMKGLMKKRMFEIIFLLNTVIFLHD